MDDRDRIVIHVTTEAIDDWRRALRNVSNLYREDARARDPATLALVINGPAVRFLLETSPEAARLGKMLSAGVVVRVCRNSLDRFGHDPDRLVPGVEVVPSGVAEVVRLQEAGATPLKLP